MSLLFIVLVRLSIHRSNLLKWAGNTEIIACCAGAVVILAKAAYSWKAEWRTRYVLLTMAKTDDTFSASSKIGCISNDSCSFLIAILPMRRFFHLVSIAFFSKYAFLIPRDRHCVISQSE